MARLDQLDAKPVELAASRDSARARWLRFFGLLLPAAFVCFGIVTEVIGYELRGIQPFRNSMDAIAAAAERVPGNARWLIFGDSLTQHVLMDYRLGAPETVANLTTHAGAGLPSVYLLLRRYLATHAAPRAIVIAMAPEGFANIPDEKDGRFWLTPTFLEPDEQAWLGQFYPTARSNGWLPAAFDIKAAVLAPLTGLLARHRDRLVTGAAEPSPDRPVEPAAPASPVFAEAEAARATHHLELGATRIVLTDICHLARRHGIAVHLLVAPVPAHLRRLWEARGELARLEDQLRALATRECGTYLQFDMANVIQPPNFDDEATHIAGQGWMNRYAVAFRDYMANADNISNRQ